MPLEGSSPIAQTSTPLTAAQASQESVSPPYALHSFTTDHAHRELSHGFYDAIQVITAPISFSIPLSRLPMPAMPQASGAIRPLSHRYTPYYDPWIRQPPNPAQRPAVAAALLPEQQPPSYSRAPAARDGGAARVVGWTTGGAVSRPTLLPRQRSAKACNRCRRRKTKCSGDAPCLRCVGRGLQCTYDEASAVRNALAQRRSAPTTPEVACSRSGSRSLDGRIADLCSLPVPIAAVTARNACEPGVESVLFGCEEEPGHMHPASVAQPPALAAPIRIDMAKGADDAASVREIWGATPPYVCPSSTLGSRPAAAEDSPFAPPANQECAATRAPSNDPESAGTWDLPYGAGGAGVAAAWPAPASHQGVEPRVPNAFALFASSSLQDALKERPFGRPF